MLGLNAQDLWGSLIAIALYPIIAMIPGYISGWAINWFNFRKRSFLGKWVTAIVLSNAIMPIVSYLGSRFLSLNFLIIALLFTTCIFLIVLIGSFVINKNQSSISYMIDRLAAGKTAFLPGGIWIVFALFLLVDIQLGSRLYFANVSYDYTTRIAIINAISRTGIPPVNPGYFPGHSEKLTYLYYYWYILPAVVDLIGGAFVNSRQAMIAGTIWSGIGLMATLALYLRLRNQNSTSNEDKWTAPFIGIQLLMIAGLDFIPVSIIEVSRRLALGHMVLEGTVYNWNLPVISWLNAVTWVPNHVSAVMQCMTAAMVILTADKSSNKSLIACGLLSGICFASAFGTSTWVTLVFAFVWVIWAFLLGRKGQGNLFWTMAAAGLVGLGLTVPFASSILNQPGSPTALLPIALYVRPFSLVQFLAPGKLQPWINLLFLPVNYLMELGLLFILGLYRLQHYKDIERQDHHFLPAETILLALVVVMLSFVYSTVENINDLGIRGWLLGQFILLIWATDIIHGWLGHRPPTPKNIFDAIGRQPKIGRAMQILLIIGILTTALEAFLTRTWPLLIDWKIAGFPNNLSSDTNLGRRTYDAKSAYEFINSHLPDTSIIQYNPDIHLDRPGGLYGERQAAISDRSSYGVSLSTFQAMQRDLAAIFERDTAWDQIDEKCTQYSISALVVTDSDPLWDQLPELETQRKPLYQIQHYSVIGCGNY